MTELGGIPVGLAGQLREAVVSLGPDGAVEWANDAAGRLLRLAPADLVGESALDRVHPDEVARALDGIAYSSVHPDRTAVVPFRIRRGDDTWADVELMSSVVPGDDGDHLVLVLRDAAPRRAVGEALATVATGAPIEETARWLARVLEARWPGTLAGVVLDGPGGAHLLAAEAWPADLRDALLAATRTSSWREVTSATAVTVRTADDLPDGLAAVAGAHGLDTLGVAPVPDPGPGSAALVAWFDEPDAARMELVHASVELCELLALALERRHHLSRLDHAVRHDVLTGLLNRTGFLQLAERWAADLAAPDGGAVWPATAAADRRTALLYLDLDGFKPVNDRWGHAVGDAVLRVVAGRITAVAATGSWSAARIGGDEFVVLGAGGRDLGDGAVAMAERLVAELTEPIEVATTDGETVTVTVGTSIGVAVTADDLDGLLELADGAMYAVKAAGGRAWSAHLP